MQRWIVPVLLAAMVLPAAAEKRLTVAQLEQKLAAFSASHKKDAEMIRQIGVMELSERLTEPTLNRLDAYLPQGSKSLLALRLLADQSAFLDPPPSEVPATPAPDDAAQREMVRAAVHYVLETLPRLPNFLTTRTVNRYDDSPQALGKRAEPVRAGLHKADTSSREISVNNEREDVPSTKGSTAWKPQIGFVSGGEFGATLGMILSDSAKGTVTWSHWEETAEGRAAVFQYSVPKVLSHFVLSGAIERREPIAGVLTHFGDSRDTARNGDLHTDGLTTTNTSAVHETPAYHGSIWLDPATGTILCVTIIADTRDNPLFKRADMMVQYGPVQIADRTYICPVRSVALSVAAKGAQSTLENAPTLWLNETLFTGYHRFIATTRILTGDVAPQ